jgi:hypothetical protein
MSYDQIRREGKNERQISHIQKEKKDVLQGLSSLLIPFELY